MTQIHLEDHVVFTRFESDGDGVLLNLRTKNYYTLNETAAFIWTRLEAGAELESLFSELAERYEIGPDEAQRAVRGLVTDLEEEGLVKTQAS